ncbi:DUF6520 family protein [Parapedobacter sp. 2B3]|uniref:DUF6520 family protein n=1 Tax=Parapedobacter sp. 2B3 TaxID=3342381 RepID=UPI0035B61231
MATIAKKLKISLTAIAFVLGIGAAFATNTNIQNALADCQTQNPDVDRLPNGQIECPGDGQLCCTIGTTEYEKN